MIELAGTVNNLIWGTPLLSSHAERWSFSPGGEVSPSIERELHTFLLGQIQRWQPDLIIVVERKGTAILRALKEWDESPLDWPWDRVISSESIDQVPDEQLQGKRLLVFDDMMKTGGHIRKLIEQLYARGIIGQREDSFRVAVFAVHTDSDAQISYSGGKVPYSWFYRYLTSTSYQGIHSQIVLMLQRAGSLMLDTEHIEVRVKLQSNFNRFVEVLSRKAEAYVFHSSEQRTNITVFYKDDKAHPLPSDIFPEGTNFSNIVRKCRIVQRVGSADEFAIIPICFPSIPLDSLGWPSKPEIRELLGEGALRSKVGRFYGAGLLAALHTLSWVLKDISILDSSEYSLSLPKSPMEDDAKGGYDLQHLQVIFPSLDIDRLTQHITSIEKVAHARGAELKHLKLEPSRMPFYTDEELHHDAIILLQLIRYALDQRRAVLGWEAWEREHYDSPGLTLKEILRIGRKMSWPDARTSTLCDILIDQATLSTEVQAVEDENGVFRMMRTFAPAGEVISELVRRYTTQWGLPHGF